MKKNLRLFLVAALAMVGMNASAQEVTFDFNTMENNWGLPTTKTVDETSYTYGGYTIKIAGTSGKSEGFAWNSITEEKEVVGHYLILGKNGAYLTLPAFSFDVDKIEVVGRAGASSAVKQNIFVGENAASTETAGAIGTNTYMIKKDYQAAGNVYTLKVTSSANTQITKINIYKSSGVTAPEISGSDVFCGSTQVTITADEGAAIYYTTDGVEPTTNSLAYTAPFTIENSCTVKAVASKGGAMSSVVSMDFVKTTGDGSKTNPFTCADIVSLPAGYTASDKWVKGIIVGSIQNAGSLASQAQPSNVALAAAAGETEWANIVPVALPANSEIRAAINLVDNEGNMGKELLVKGTVTAYFGAMGVKDLVDAIIDGSSVVTGINDVKVVPADQENAPVFNLAGQKVNANYKGVVIKGGKKMIVK